MTVIEFFLKLLSLAGDFITEAFNMFVGFSPVWIVLSIMFGVMVLSLVFGILRGRKF